jgi:membrane-associated protease RseP (regulator of RpoE activity)
MGFAAWFGLFATALNLFPIAQLDGGHISDAAFGRKSTTVTVVSLIALVGLGFVTPSWFVLVSLLLIMMIVSGGLRHPPTLDEHVPLDRTRLWVAVAAAIIFALCFTPAPFDIGGLTDVP